MGVSANRLYGPAHLTTSAVAIVTSGANVTTQVTTAVVANVGTGVNTVSIYVVPSGGSADLTTLIVDALPLDEGSSAIVGPLVAAVLQPGDAIHALASAADSVNILISGNRIS